MMRIRRIALLGSLIVAMPICILGCFGGLGGRYDVSNDPRYLNSMSIGQKFALESDVFMWDVNHNRLFFDRFSPSYWLVKPGKHTDWYGQLAENLPTVEEHHRTHEPSGIRGIVSSGTALSLAKIIFEDNPLRPIFYSCSASIGPGAIKNAVFQTFLKCVVPQNDL